MDLIKQGPYGSSTTRSIEDAVVHALDQQMSHDGGSVECAAAHAQACADMLGEVIKTLHAKGLFTNEDVLALLPGYAEYRP